LKGKGEKTYIYSYDNRQKASNIINAEIQILHIMYAYIIYVKFHLFICYLFKELIFITQKYY